MTSPKVSLAMIVRDEERNLPHCLESVRGLFDEIVIIDTGSTDRTKKIALSFGAKVIDFQWIDDFSAARNISLINASGDYAFWMDADDILDAPEKDKLANLLQTLPAKAEAAYVMRCASDPDTVNNSGLIVTDHIRLFPVKEHIRWTYRVHEQILPALMQAEIPTEWTDIIIRHTGYADATQKAKKRQRDWDILFKELAAHPNDPFVFYNLGMIAFERSQWPEALGFFKCSFHGLPINAANESLRRKLFGMIAWSHQILGNMQKSLQTCEEGLAFEPDNAELWFRKAVALRYMGQTLLAEICWKHILTLTRPEKFSSIDQGIYGHLTRRNLAIIAAENGNHSEAKHYWQEVFLECPSDKMALEQLSDQ